MVHGLRTRLQTATRRDLLRHAGSAAIAIALSRPGAAAALTPLTFEQLYKSIGVRGLQFSDLVLALKGQMVVMHGYMAPPLKAESKFFVLTREPMAICPFCQSDADWPSDITVTVNGKDVGTWTSPGDFGDKRGVYTPDWWKLKGSQYGMLKTWKVAKDGTYVDGMKISPVSLKDLDMVGHHSIRLRIGVKDNARNPGGMNIFGRGFGNYDQDIVLRIHTGQ